MVIPVLKCSFFHLSKWYDSTAAVVNITINTNDHDLHPGKMGSFTFETTHQPHYHTIQVQIRRRWRQWEWPREGDGHRHFQFAVTVQLIDEYLKERQIQDNHCPLLLLTITEDIHKFHYQKWTREDCQFKQFRWIIEEEQRDCILLETFSVFKTRTIGFITHTSIDRLLSLHVEINYHLMGWIRGSCEALGNYRLSPQYSCYIRGFL